MSLSSSHFKKRGFMHGKGYYCSSGKNIQFSLPIGLLAHSTQLTPSGQIRSQIFLYGSTEYFSVQTLPSEGSSAFPAGSVTVTVVAPRSSKQVLPLSSCPALLLCLLMLCRLRFFLIAVNGVLQISQRNLALLWWAKMLLEQFDMVELLSTYVSS